MKKVPQEARTEFSRRLNQAWHQSDWGRATQKEISDYLGISSQQVSHYFSGTRLPSIPAAKKLSEMFGCSFEWLLTGESPKSKRSLEDAWNQASDEERAAFFSMLAKITINK